MNLIYRFLGGRSTFFALVFTTSGVVLAFQGKLTGVFVALVGAIQALVFAHSAKEDHYCQKMREEREEHEEEGKQP